MYTKDYTELPKVHPILAWISGLLIRITGWKIEGGPPDIAKTVFIGAPHTSMWDVFYMMLMSWSLGVQLHWLAAADIVPQLRWLVPLVNGIIINRDDPNSNTVQQVVNEFNRRDKLALMLAPEGRTRYTEYWRSGFYYMALGAKAPIVCGYMNYEARTIGLREPFYPTGDIDADMNVIASFYDGAVARHPENFGPVAVRKRTKAMNDRLSQRATQSVDTASITAEEDGDAANRAAG